MLGLQALPPHPALKVLFPVSRTEGEMLLFLSTEFLFSEWVTDVTSDTEMSAQGTSPVDFILNRKHGTGM